MVSFDITFMNFLFAALSLSLRDATMQNLDNTRWASQKIGTLLGYIYILRDMHRHHEIMLTCKYIKFHHQATCAIYSYLSLNIKNIIFLIHWQNDAGIVQHIAVAGYLGYKKHGLDVRSFW